MVLRELHSGIDRESESESERGVKTVDRDNSIIKSESTSKPDM